MYGNAFEAFIGAIYIDQGYDRCKQFMEKKIFKSYIDLDKMSRKEVNFKSKLIEWSQKNKLEVSFELIEQLLDKDYNPMFHTEVRILGLSAGKGRGYSKKESQQNAAQMALKKLKSDPQFMESLEALKAQATAAAAQAAEESQATEAEPTQADSIAPASEPLAVIETAITVETEIDASAPETTDNLLTELSDDTSASKA